MSTFNNMALGLLLGNACANAFFILPEIKAKNAALEARVQTLEAALHPTAEKAEL